MDRKILNLNRSFSDPDIHSYSPYFRQVLVCERYQMPNHDKPLIRQCSYTEVVGGSNNTFQINNFGPNKTWSERSLCNFSDSQTDWLNYNMSHLSSQFRAQNFCSSPQVKENKTEEGICTMECDSESSVESEKMDVDDSCAENLEADHRVKTARRLNDISIKPKQQSDNSKHYYSIYLITPIIIALFCYVFWQSLFKMENRGMHIVPDLKSVLYQDHVVEITSDILNNLDRKNSKNVLVFVGTTGVGKTYIANLIKKQFPKEFIIDLDIALQNHFNIASKLSQRGCYFIVIDNLKIKDLEAISIFINTLPDQCVLVVPIFNIHEVSNDLIFAVNIDHFKKIKLKFEEKFPMIANVILFNNLNRNTVEKWLRLQIKERGLSNEEEIISSLLEKYDVEVYGFKGLIPKINIFEL